MNIYAKPGDKVIFLNRNGHDHEPDDAVAVGLVEGGTYTVNSVEVFRYTSLVTLEEFPERSFNTVMFADEQPRGEGPR